MEKKGARKKIEINHRQPKLYGCSLDFEFLRECMKINKIRPKLHFSTKVEIKMTCLVFVSCYLCTYQCKAGGGGGGRAWGGDLIVFECPGVGHLTDPVLPGEGIFESFFARR